MTDPAEITARLQTAKSNLEQAKREIHREWHAIQSATGYKALNDLEWALSRVAVLEAQKQAALELHWAVTTYDHPLHGVCLCCEEVWPCATVRALGGEETS